MRSYIVLEGLCYEPERGKLQSSRGQSYQLTALTLAHSTHMIPNSNPQTRAEIEDIYSAGLSRLSYGLRSKKFRRISGHQSQIGGVCKRIPDRFPMYQLIQDLAKFTELAAIQHKTISTGLIGSVSRMSKAMPKIRRDLIDMYLGVIVRFRRERG